MADVKNRATYSLRKRIKKRVIFFKYSLRACLLLPTLAGASAQIPLSSPLPYKAITTITAKYGKSAKQRMQAWQKLMTAATDKSESEKVLLVNEFFNQLQYVSDRDHWGQKDFWASPLEMLATNGGDCEDFSIAKYFTLKTMGIPVERLRITHTITRRQKQSHIVLTYYPAAEHSSLGAEPLVLDNRQTMITPLSQRSDLLPVYSFNSQGVWIQKKQGQIKTANPHSIKPWSTLITKMQRQGLYL